MRDVVIIDGVRSPIGKFGGVLSSIRPDDLLAEVYRSLFVRTGVDLALLKDVYAGWGNQAGEDNRDVARMAVLLAGFPKEVPGVTVNRNCASALEAVNHAAKTIIAGEGKIYIGSGVESMSRAAWVMAKPQKTPTMGHPQMWDTTVGWRFNNPKLDELYPIITLGETAENITNEMQISREDQDAFSVEPHARAVATIDGDKFKDEFVPITVLQRCGNPIVVDTDERPRYKEENGRYRLATSVDGHGQAEAGFP